MPHAFDKITDRRDSFSMKWDTGEDELPMWVADMDFETAPAVIEALRKKVDTGIFGYTIIPAEYTQAVSSWWNRRHQFSIEQDWILFATGVVPAISSIVRKVTDVGENVLIQPPVYNIFYNSIRNNGRNILENKLIYRDDHYIINFDDLECKLADPQTTLMILCNPHNPIGKVWDRTILARIGELCAKYQVPVLSDEIHCDLTDPGVSYTPFASVSDLCAENSITCIAPSKAFNLAGLQSASIVIPNPHIRHKVNRGLNTDEVAEPNAFAIEATIAAYTQGEAWLDELRTYLKSNKDIATEYIHRNIPQIQIVPSEATYLLWLNCYMITYDTSRLCEIIRNETGLYLSSGSAYGENGKSFLRMNFGTQQRRVLDGLERLKRGIQQYETLTAKDNYGINSL